MMKRLVKLSVAGLLVAGLFAGCANNGLAVGTVGKQQEVKEFKEGSVKSTKKVLVSKSMTAVLTGAGVGAVAGGVADKSVKGAAIGGIVGAGVGFITGMVTNNNEVPAYRTVIKSGKTSYTAYLKTKLKKDTKVEFVTRENGKITNVSVL